jgi:hypothetical protein
VNAAEFAQLVRSISNETFEPSSEVCVDLRRINVGQAGRAGGNGPYSGYSARSNATEEIVKVVLKGAAICLICVASDIRAFGKDVDVPRVRRGHPAEGMI